MLKSSLLLKKNAQVDKTSHVNNSKILRIENAVLSECRFYINMDFQI